ncbi:MAG TPA: hypothetical protein VNL71_13915, partial [Chloroflexota bacterium]|nr:hypothetical protein [Chloroflexota bacterium]
MDADQLLDHAQRLIDSRQVGAPRQVDLRRGVSASYYALFHALCARASATFAGVTTAYSNYGVLIYRALDHG